MLTANGSILQRCIYHFGPNHPSLRATITKSDLQLAVRVIGLVWFRTSSSGLRNFRRKPLVRVLTKISRKYRPFTFGDFENLSPRLDLEIFARCRIRASIKEDLKTSLQSRALQ
uniref:Uncharacterized protein n=1 Tax=Vespula pensylvanica TaxID=30213 RepID=A0A834K4H6_VESPE|nr:hypothetical protein H0235_015695 [Vespula pensylvanica]